MAGLFATASSNDVSAGSGGDRTIWRDHTHTHESGRFTFKHNGVYDQKVLNQLNVFLADWRNKKTTHMDPRLFDLLWEVSQEVGATQPYNIVSAYRSPETNAYLRSKSSAVAEHSQHMLGHAMDVFIPGIPLDKLRAAAMRHQVGGVGYYPTSGSPFVHMDVGSVRAWPRMTRAQLVRLFPDGKTLHLPVDGTPLSDQGRLYAQAEWNKCHMVPCRADGAVPAIDTGVVRVASLDPAQRSVSTINIVAPMPMPSLGAVDAGDDEEQAPTAVASIDPNAVVPMSKTPSLMLATRGSQSLGAESALAAIDSNTDSAVTPMPLPRVLMSPDEQQVLTAYAPEIAPDPGAQKALEMIIARETAAQPPDKTQTPDKTLIDTSEIRTASLGGTNGLSMVKNIFDMTWSAVTEANGQSALASTLPGASIVPDPVVGLRQRATDLIAPEIDHVNETLATPVPMTSMHFADMTEPEGYLDNAAELGPMASRMQIESDLVAPPRYDRFVRNKPMFISSRS